MTLKRNAFLKIANVDIQLYKTLNRRGQLPTSPIAVKMELEVADPLPDADGKDTPLEALKLHFADVLVTNNSFSRKAAADLFSGLRVGFSQAIARAEAGEDIWFVAGGWSFPGEAEAPRLEEQLGGVWSFTEFGTLHEVNTAISEEIATTKAAGGVVSHISMFFMTPLVQAALERGREFGVTSFVNIE